MSDTADRYRKLAAAFTAKVESVPDDRWTSATPCSDWTARDLVRHVVDTQGLFLGFVDRTLPDSVSVDDVPVAAWSSARDVVQAGLDDPAVATMEYDAFGGRSTFEKGVGTFLCADLVVHGWDLARATGQDESMDLAEVSRVRTDMAKMGDMLRSPGAFGPEVAAPDGADEQSELLAFLGRHP